MKHCSMFTWSMKRKLSEDYPIYSILSEHLFIAVLTLCETHEKKCVRQMQTAHDWSGLDGHHGFTALSTVCQEY